MKKAVMYGAGSIGRGFIGQLFSLSGYEVVFLDINQEIIGRLNMDKQYPLRLVSAQSSTETIITNVRGVYSADVETAMVEVATADILATAVGVNVLPRIAPVIAGGLVKRWRTGYEEPLNIIICENLIDANKILKRLIIENLPQEYHVVFQEKVGLVEASIGRMVPVASVEMQDGNLLRVWAEPYNELPVDFDGFRGEIPKIAGMKPFTPFQFYIERKLYLHNMGHATLAYLGRLAGYEMIWQAVRDDKIAAIACGALLESSQALSRKYNIPIERLSAFSEDLMARFDNPPLADTVLRVGRDPSRKLMRSDRLVGAAFNCLGQGVLPECICMGIAAALLYNNDSDPASLEIQKCLVERGIEETLSHYCGIIPDSPLFKMVQNALARRS